MGADLICYIAFGPRNICIDDSVVAEVAQHVRGYLDTCITAAERVLLGMNDVPGPRRGPVEAKRSITLRLPVKDKLTTPTFASVDELRSHPDYRDLMQSVLGDSDYDVESRHVFTGTPEELAKAVQEFVEAWNDSCFRDTSYRIDPDKPDRKVVVAGELSWGDEPDGFGYQMLKKAFGLGIAQRLGVT